jgi:outer membrane receptor for ferrienterochelin and colicins
VNFTNGLKIITGVSFLDNRNIENGTSTIPVLTERFTGTWNVSYKIKPINVTIDYTGNIYGSMQLPLLNNLDPRAPNSPVHSIQNVQFTYSGIKNFEFYGGLKNLLNFLPKQNNPFLIARANDPFETNVEYDANGQVLATAQNPYGLTFDTTYIYAQNQGIRGFFGLRYTLR